MRELKFRQWQGKGRPFHYFEFKDGMCSSVTSASLSQYPIMQFTGLLDKNGKEIYEGDIVDLQPDQYDKIWHRVIEYDTAAFHCRAIHTSANHPLHFHKFAPDKKWVVIGNIYENPEHMG